MPTLKLHSNVLLYSNTVIGTLAVDGWAVTFGTAMMVIPNTALAANAAFAHCLLGFRVFCRVCVCLSVCPLCSWIVSKRINISFKFFSPSGSQAILVYFLAKRHGNILTSNADGLGRNRDLASMRAVKRSGGTCVMYNVAE